MKVATFRHTCQACPSQWDGKLEDGRRFYVRYRWGHLSVSVSLRPTDDLEAAVGGMNVVSLDHGHAMDGFLSFERLVELTPILDWSDAKAEL